MKLHWKIAGLIATIAFALTGCASPMDRAEAGRAEAGVTGDAPLHTAARQSGAERAVMRSGSVDVEVADLAKAEIAMKEAVGHAAGYLVHEEGLNLASESPVLHVVVRVPETTFEATMTSFETLGRCTAKSIEASDLTEQILDVQARMKHAASKANGQMGPLQQNLAELQMMAKMSTIELNMVQKPSPSAVAAGNANWSGDTWDRALSSAIGAFRAIGAVLIWVFVYLPFWLPVVGLFWLSRAARRKIGARPRPVVGP